MVSAATASVLRVANLSIRLAPADQAHELAEACLRAGTALAPIDSFYVGTYEHGRQVHMSYVFDGARRRGPDRIPFGPHEMSAHVLQTGHTYVWSSDGGALVHQGVSFGDSQQLSKDAVVVPLKHQAGSVVGLMGFLSYSHGAFTREHTAAFEWLADAYSVAAAWHSDYLNRVDQDVLAPAKVALPEGEALLGIQQKLTQALDALSPNGIEGHLDIELARRRCNAALELASSAARAGPALDTRDLHVLSTREQEIALRVRQGRTNAQIARDLHLAERTVKGHMTRIMAKLGVMDRAQV